MGAIELRRQPTQVNTLGSTTHFGPSATTTEGWSYASSFVDVTALGTRKLLGQLGVVVDNDSGAAIEYCRVRFRADVEN